MEQNVKTEKLKLWLISQDANSDWDTYDSAVVVADSEEAARLIFPADYDQPPVWSGDAWRYAHGSIMTSSGWTTPDNVKAECVGIAADGLKAGDVVCASYNAG
jgi:hypothetical protein